VQNTVSLKIKEPPENTPVFVNAAQNKGFSITWCHILFPVYIWLWFAAITMGTGKQAPSLPANLLLEEVFFHQASSFVKVTFTADTEHYCR